MVGGSWRALARIDMLATDFPLPITHQYRMKPARATELRQAGSDARPAAGRSAAAPPRLATSPVAAMLLDLLVDELEPSSSSSRPSASAKACSIRELEAERQAHRPADRSGARRRRRRASLRPAWRPARRLDRARCSTIRRRCAGCASPPACSPTSPGRPTPASAPTAGIEMALHGNWVAVDPAGRVIMAQALVVELRPRPTARLASSRSLCTDEQLEARASTGASRCASASGCRAASARCSSAPASARNDGALRLDVRRGEEALIGETVKRRLAPPRRGARLQAEVVAVASSGVAFPMRRG